MIFIGAQKMRQNTAEIVVIRKLSQPLRVKHLQIATLSFTYHWLDINCFKGANAYMFYDQPSIIMFYLYRAILDQNLDTNILCSCLHVHAHTVAHCIETSKSNLVWLSLTSFLVRAMLFPFEINRSNWLMGVCVADFLFSYQARIALKC